MKHGHLTHRKTLGIGGDKDFVKTQLSQYVLKSKPRKQFLTLCVALGVVWSVVATVILLYTYVIYIPSIQEQSSQSRIGSFKGPKWKNAKQTLSTDVIYENEWLSLSKHVVKTPKNQTINDWLWVDTMHQVNVLVSIAVKGQDANNALQGFLFVCIYLPKNI
ncbi:hypothetical protein RFI_30211 [Reticulomyxa filosa]|uniref:Uncharacterized protein n=1 Tax=Reticulomyxa filosa TaxID=46433 RepID=X6M0N3_RETFI|nr:hypothetical protein RFI_30211 [Reticulomyxa filosa]|eukprot:ETO07181.1 hypothetical protein RFI_30211 [Reticulomyxa filosa]